MELAVAYYRVSTRQQHRSGLGIEAQRATVTRFAETENLRIIAEYVEAETGKGADALDRRPQLAAALAAARNAKGCVLVSKLDRLSRDVAFVAGLMAQRIPFIVAELGRRSLHAASLRRLGREGAAAHLRTHQGRAGDQKGERRQAWQSDQLSGSRRHGSSFASCQCRRACPQPLASASDRQERGRYDACRNNLRPQ